MNLLSKLKPEDFSKNSSDKFYDRRLEGLRGIAALNVAYAHIMGYKYILDPGYTPQGYFPYFHAAQVSVLIFFVLSGYVIGLTNYKAFSQINSLNYLLRRYIRILPIYIISVIFGITLSKNISFSEIWGFFFFLQPFFISKNLPGNPILWSLSYEVLYYVLFILIWRFAPRIIIVFASCFLLSLLGGIFPSFPQSLSSYSSGFLFWLCGLILAWKIKPHTEEAHQIPIISYLLILIATNQFEPGMTVLLNKLGFLKSSFAGYVNLGSIIIYLPICILIISKITRRKFYGQNLLSYLCLLIPLANMLFLLLTGRLFEHLQWGVASICLLLSMILYQSKLDILSKLAPLGKISYAFYVLHFPTALLVRNIFPYQGSLWTFIARLLVWFVLTVLLSGILELIIQPQIKTLLFGKTLKKI